MAISVKSKFAGFLRGLIGRAEHRVPARQAAPAAPAPAPAPAFKPAPASALPAKSRLANSDEIELPLAPVIAVLPLDLRGKVMAAPTDGQTIRLPSEMVMSQLAFGAVKISFGELRQLVPGLFANSGGELDNKLINLPLQLILSHLNPALLACRASRKAEVADEIVGPFADRGRGFTFTTQPLKAAAATVPTPAPEPPMAFVSPTSVRHISPPPFAPPISQRSITPALPANGLNGGNGHPVLPVSPISPRSGTPPPTNGAAANGQGNGHNLSPGLRLGSLNSNTHAELPSPIRMAPASMAAPSPAPTRPTISQPTIFVTVGDLCENWPEPLKNDILRSPLAHATAPLDGSIILPGLKRGRIVMPWKQLRLLAQPSSSPSPHDNLELELPLKVIAPLFLAAQKVPAKAQTKASVSSDIPDLFFGFPQPATAPVVPAAPAAPVVPQLFAVAPPKPPDTNFYVWDETGVNPQADDAALRRTQAPQTDFMSRTAHPKDVVARAAALPGVAGAVVALQDGLRVASQVPPDLNAETLAAFLPQIFERLNQSTRELRMGVLNNLNFTVGNVPWKIFRVNAVYFAAFGRAGETFPSAQLAQLAAELDRKKTS